MSDSLQYERALGVQIIMLAPLAPHFASELWTAFVDNSSKHSSDFDWVCIIMPHEIGLNDVQFF